MAASIPYEDILLPMLRDPKEAALYLDAALAERDLATFLIAVSDVARARGGMSALAFVSGLNRENLYRMLSKNGNPSVRGLERLLRTLGLRLSVTALDSRSGKARA